MRHYSFENAAITIAGTHGARELLEPIFTDRKRELLIVASCDRHLRLLALLCLPGSRDAVRVRIPEIFRHAVESNAEGIVLAHNHPSGKLIPSSVDTAFTKRLTIVAEALDVALLDHLIFNHGPPFSFRQAGLI